MAQQPNFKVPAVPQRRIFAKEKINLQRNLSIPGPIFYHMIRNPKYARVWNKFKQTCKYVFWKNKLIVFNDMSVKGNSCQFRKGWGRGTMNVDLRKIAFKFWLNGHLNFCFCYVKFDSNLFLFRLYRSDVTWLGIKDTIQWDVYQKLITSDMLQSLVITKEIKNADGSVANVDQILRPLSQLKSLYWSFLENSSVKTVKDVDQFAETAGNFGKLKILSLFGIPEELFEAFADFFKKNKTINYVAMRLNSSVLSPDLSEKYKQMLETFMEEVIENPIDKVPRIEGYYRNVDRYLVEKYQELYVR